MLRIFLFLVVFFSSITCYAAQKIKLGVESTNYFPMYGTFDANDKEVGEYVGFAADVFRLYNKSQSDFELEFEPRPIKRLFSEFLSDNSPLDAKFPDNAYWAPDLKKGKNVIYSDPVVDYTDGVFVLKENQNLELSKIKTLGALAGFTPFDYNAQIKSGQITVQDSMNTTALLEKLVQKKVDVVYISKFIGTCKLAKAHNDNVVFSETLPHNSSFYSLSSVKYPKLIASFNEFLKSHKDEIEKIKQDYIENKCK